MQLFLDVLQWNDFSSNKIKTQFTNTIYKSKMSNSNTQHQQSNKFNQIGYCLYISIFMPNSNGITCTIAHKLNSYPTKRSEANRIRYYLFCLYYLLLIDFSRFSSLVLSIDVIILFFSYKIIISILNNNQKIELNWI